MRIENIENEQCDLFDQKTGCGIKLSPLLDSVCVVKVTTRSDFSTAR